MLSKKNYVSGITVTISVLLATSEVVQAKEIENYDDYRSYCSPAAYQYDVQSPDCDKFKQIFEQRDRQENNAQPTRRDTQIKRRTRRNSRERNSVKGYIGSSAGLFFPDTDLLDTGFGVSLYGGARFNKNFATDIEVDLLGGGTAFQDEAYGVFAVFINPRVIFPFSDEERSPSIYVSPGIGFSAIGIGDGNTTVTDDTRLTWQTKAGISFPFTERLSGFGQIRYASQTEDFTVDFFGTELGLNFEF